MAYTRRIPGGRAQKGGKTETWAALRTLLTREVSPASLFQSPSAQCQLWAKV